MDKRLKSSIAEILRPPRLQPIYEWAEENVVFAKPYKAIADGPYDSSLTPFWREPMDAILDRAIREVWVLKAAQAGGSENMLLMPMRHAVCCRPMTILYISGEQKATEEFIRERIKPGLQLSIELRQRYAEARVLEHQLYYPDMMIVCGWSTSSGIVKQRPADLVLADEFDTWDEFAPDKLRKRVGTRPFSTIVGISSLDARKKRPTSESPIWVEYGRTDKREYWLPEPRKRNSKTQKWFKFKMGWKDRKSGRESPFGLKWSEDARLPDGEWDPDVVAESAYYLTPGGTKLTDEKKLELLEEGRGKWIPRVKVTDHSKRGYRLPSFYLPWETFGGIAKRFLDAKEKSKASLRVFIYEDLCEGWKDEVEDASENEAWARQGEYAKGTQMTESGGKCNDAGDTFKEFYLKKQKMVQVTADVQKMHLVWVAREWVKGGDSGLMDCGICIEWHELDRLATQYGAAHVLVDSAYGERTQEVYEASYKYRFIPTQGKENIASLLFTETYINPFEGTRRQKEKNVITLLLYKTDPFKTQLLERVKGESKFGWYVYQSIELEYVNQVTAEHKVNGIWKIKPGHHQRNHYWDCEVLQVLGATRFGFNRFKGYED